MMYTTNQKNPNWIWLILFVPITHELYTLVWHSAIYSLLAFLEILPWLGPYVPGPLIIWKNIPNQICSRRIIWMHTALGACLLYVPGTVFISNMVLEHIWLRIFFQIINGPGPYGPGALVIWSKHNGQHSNTYSTME